jgi:hypothetical protein
LVIAFERLQYRLCGDETSINIKDFHTVTVTRICGLNLVFGADPGEILLDFRGFSGRSPRRGSSGHFWLHTA